MRRRALALLLLLGAAPAAGAPPLRAPDETPNDYLARLARAAPPGSYPRWVGGEQSHWTVVGVPVDEKEAALSEDGALEVEKETSRAPSSESAASFSSTGTPTTVQWLCSPPTQRG